MMIYCLATIPSTRNLASFGTDFYVIFDSTNFMSLLWPYRADMMVPSCATFL